MTTRARRNVMIIGSLALSALLLGTAFLVSPENSRLALQGIFVTAGAAVLLLIPLEWASQHLRKDVRAAVGEVEKSTDAKLTEVRRRLTDLEKLDQESREAHDQARAKDHEKFDAIVSLDATGETLHAALARAERLGLIGRQGVWTDYSEHSYLSIRFSILRGQNKRVEAILYALDRREVLGRFYIDRNQRNLRTIDRLRELARRNGDNTVPTVSVIFKGVADTLKFAEAYPEDAPLLQHFPQQWALTESAIIAPSYGQEIPHAQRDRVDRDVEMKKKSWLDYDSYHEAHHAAERQFPLTDKQRETGGLESD